MEISEQILSINLEETIDGEVIANGKWMSITVEPDGYTTLQSSNKQEVLTFYPN